jgi:hypothetical protein
VKNHFKKGVLYEENAKDLRGYCELEAWMKSSLSTHSGVDTVAVPWFILGRLIRNPVMNVKLSRPAQIFTRALNRIWQQQTLAGFHGEVAREPNGAGFMSFRLDRNGPRTVLAFCLTQQQAISIADKNFDLSKPAAVNWGETTLAELAVRAVLEDAGGFICDSRKGATDEITALVIIAVRPHSITVLEYIFNLPP